MASKDHVERYRETNVAPDPSLVEIEDCARSLDVDLVSGLSDAEAGARLHRVGANRIEAEPPVPAWRQLLMQFADPLVYLLLAAVIVSLVAWMLEGAHGTPFETIVIAAIVLANGVLGFVQERKAEQAVAALQRMARATTAVIRDGVERRVAATDVVPGDVLVLREGDAVSADARLVEVASLRVAESSLTGESEPVEKDASRLLQSAALGDRANMVFSGTAVTRGRGRALVTTTGMATEMGKIATLLERTEEERTPLQREVDLVSRSLGIAVIAVAVVVVAAVVLTSGVHDVTGLIDVLLLGVSLAVAAVPEGLSAILTVVLALGVRRMARRNAIVKKLSSVEALGSASVICSDKTGTLTKNEMTIQRVVTRSGEATVTGIGYRPEGRVEAGRAPLVDGRQLSEVEAVLAGGSLANDAVLLEHDGTWSIEGDPTDAAFLVAERKLGLTERRAARFSRVGEVPFTSKRKLMTSIEADAARDGRIAVVTKGAPDVLLARCTRERNGDREEVLTAGRRAEILGSVDRLAEDALRTLGVPYRPLEDVHIGEADESLEAELVFAGIVGIIDPPRPEAAAAIQEAHSAGMRVLMITGDHPRTAERIAAALGITGPDVPVDVLNGGEIERLDDESFARRVRSVSVYARVAPEHKLRIVIALQSDGKLVAMTGDGVNDAPALKAADIGVAMGITGTDVAKEAANMILADDNFATIVTAVREGRGIFANIRRFLRYLISSNAGEVLTMFFGVIGASLIGLDVGREAFAAPLLATQILWINLVTDSAPAFAIGVDPPPPDVMHRPPRRITDRVIDREMQLGVLFVGVVMALATLLTIDLELPGGLIDGSHTLAHARTIGFTVLVLAQLFNCLNSRSERESAFRGLFGNPLLWAAIAASLVLQMLVVHLEILNRAFETTPLTARDWAVCAGIASFVLWLDEIKKVIVRTVVRRRSVMSRRMSSPHAS